MEIDFRPGGLPAWIGSLPVKDHGEAVRLMLEYTPEIPIWVQLPHFQAEGMVRQFAPGMPGLTERTGKVYVDAAAETFDRAMLDFFEEYVAVAEGSRSITDSRFALTGREAPGFFRFIEALHQLEKRPAAVKGQVTGPFTFATAMSDQNGRAIFYDNQLRDAAVKLIAMKARWQVEQLKPYNVPVIIFLDEPALAGYGSSAFISVSRHDIDSCLAEVIEAIHASGGTAGIHICANAEWPLVLESPVDIVSFDAYSFFDRFILYPQQIRNFMERGGILAWGIVPTGDPEAIATEDADSLHAKWRNAAERIAQIGIDMDTIIAQSLITPSCGTGSLSLEQAMKVIRMNREVSARVRGNDGI